MSNTNSTKCTTVMKKSQPVIHQLICCCMGHEATAAPYSGIDKFAEEYELPDLPYANNGLEPQMDEATVIVHHEGHHKAYTTKMNAALKEWRSSGEATELANKSILEIIRRLKEVPTNYFKAIRNNGGGYVNHDIFFACMSAIETRVSKPTGKLADDINSAFGSFEAFKEKFTAAASGVFGSGYAWLSRDKSGKLLISTTCNQESVITDGLSPILVIDVWEHAYYLKYKNKRPDFIRAWWEIVDWGSVAKLDAWWTGK